MGYSKGIDENSIAETVWEHVERVLGNLKVKVSDNSRVTEDTNKTWSGTSEVDLYQWTVFINGEIRIKIKTRRTAGSGYANLKIYKNGSLEKTLTNNSDEWVIKQYDLDVNENDVVKIAGYCNASDTSGEVDTVYLCFDSDFKFADGGAL